MAKTDPVLIQRGKNETFVLSAQQNPIEYDFSRAITVDDVIARVREGLTEMFEKKGGKKSVIDSHRGGPLHKN